VRLSYDLWRELVTQIQECHRGLACSRIDSDRETAFSRDLVNTGKCVFNYLIMMRVGFVGCPILLVSGILNYMSGTC
jgi:hypothetical protein